MFVFICFYYLFVCEFGGEWGFGGKNFNFMIFQKDESMGYTNG